MRNNSKKTITWVDNDENFFASYTSEPYPTLRNIENVRICMTCGEIWIFKVKLKTLLLLS